MQEETPEGSVYKKLRLVATSEGSGRGQIKAEETLFKRGMLFEPCEYITQRFNLLKVFK